jgi:hypothetical protein
MDFGDMVMNTTEDTIGIPVKTPIAAEILDRLTPQAKEILADFQSNIDTRRKGEICSLAGVTDFDNLWVPLLAFRIYRDRFYHHWNMVAQDPRFPNFRKASLDDMLALTAADCRPGGGVIAVIRQFGPRGYNTGWVHERLNEYVCPGWYAES